MVTKITIAILIDNNSNIDIDNHNFDILTGKITITLGEDKNGDY